MAVKKQGVFDGVEAARIRDMLDVIDVSLYDLLVKRLELAPGLPASIPGDFRELADSIRKITAARRYDPGVLDIVAGIIGFANWSARKITVASSVGDPTVPPSGNFPPLPAGVGHRRFSKLSDAVLFAAGRPDALAIVPVKKTSPKDVWWLSLLSPEGKSGKIVGRVPLAGGDEESSYIVATADDARDFDRSVAAIATSETVSAGWLKTALHRLEIPLYRVVDSTALFNGAVFHLVEISGAILGPEDPLLGLDGNIDGVAVGFAGALGGYFLPIVEKDKIVRFAPSGG